MIIHHIGESIIINRFGCCCLCKRDLSYIWWEIEPQDRLVFPDTSIRYICPYCREHEEYKWILHASMEQILLATNYTWCPPKESFPRYSSSVKEIYTRRLSGETFPPSLKFYPIE